MSKIVRIQSLDMPELAPYTRLTEAQLRNRRHPGEGLFLAEGSRVIAAALQAGCQPVSLLMEEKHLQGAGGRLAELCGDDVPVYTGENAILAKLTGYELHRGFLCAMRRPAPAVAEEICRDARRVAVLEGLTDAANLGAVFRSAAALGMDAVLLSPTCCDPLTRRAVRVSMGTVLQVPWARLGEDPAAWPQEGFRRLQAMGFRTAALALDDRSISVEDPALAAEKRLALFLGTEGEGLLPKTVAMADCTVRIPMSHGVDSLNVAAAGAVAFWQLRWREN